MKNKVAPSVCAWSIPAIGTNMYRMCKELGYTGMVINDGKSDERSAAISVKAKDIGVIVASKNALSGEGNLRVVDEVNADNFKLYDDTTNPYWHGGRLHGLALLRKVMPFVAEVHIKETLNL